MSLGSGRSWCDGMQMRAEARAAAAFEAKRQCDRRELAERFATQQQTLAGAIDDVANSL
jgi:hypothetical protein